MKQSKQCHLICNEQLLSKAHKIYYVPAVYQIYNKVYKFMLITYRRMMSRNRQLRAVIKQAPPSNTNLNLGRSSCVL